MGNKNSAARFYLDAVCATNYPDQEPAWQAARWYHLLWMLVPVGGIAFFIGSIRNAWAQRASGVHAERQV